MWVFLKIKMQSNSPGRTQIEKWTPLKAEVYFYRPG